MIHCEQQGSRGFATGGLLPFNPATAVRGPKHGVKRGKTPALAPEKPARQ